MRRRWRGGDWKRRGLLSGLRWLMAKLRGMSWFQRWYARRIVNVNVNILLAGALAIAFMYAVMYVLHKLGIDQHVADRLKVNVKLVNVTLSFLIDVVADVSVYYFLHWYANHAPGKLGGKLINPEYSDLTLMQDATKVQLERIVLSPILYGIALGGQFVLPQWFAISPPKAAAISFAAGVIIARVLHTVWMLREQRIRRAALERAGAAPQVVTTETVLMERRK
jgi:putative flippase GtrA